MSCLLLCAVETSSQIKGERFLEGLRALGPLTPKDFGNALRLALLAGDCALGLDLLSVARAHGAEVDALRFNTVLGLCASAQQMGKAGQILDEMEKTGIADVVAYNTLMKGYAMLGQPDHCFELRRRMTERGVEASQVTYGILLKVCVNARATDRMGQVFDDIVAAQCPMNTVLCTTLIQGFAKVGDVERAMEVYKRMHEHQEARPDIVTFSVLIKANCDASRLDGALGLLEEMKRLGLMPDEIIFNNLLTGCVVTKDAEVGERLYRDMVRAGVRPTTVSFSILIRLFSECKLLDQAFAFLEREPALHGVAPELRLFVQLIQCCIRQRQGKRVVEVYRAMIKHGAPDVASFSSILKTCGRLNMFDTAGELLALSTEGIVDVSDVNALLQAAVRKRRAPLVSVCVQTAERHHLCLDAAVLAQVEN